MKIGRITLLNPSAPGGSVDRHGIEMEHIIDKFFVEESEFVRQIVTNSDEFTMALVSLCDEEKCPLIITIGGTGAGPRDISPETTLKLLDKELPGFGEAMRHYSFEKSPAALLSRAVAGVRGKSLIINLPTRPKALEACLKLLREPIAEGLEQITGIPCELYVDPLVIPLEKYLPFLSWLKPKNPAPTP